MPGHTGRLVRLRRTARRAVSWAPPAFANPVRAGPAGGRRRPRSGACDGARAAGGRVPPGRRPFSVASRARRWPKRAGGADSPVAPAPRRPRGRGTGRGRSARPVRPCVPDRRVRGAGRRRPGGRPPPGAPPGAARARSPRRRRPRPTARTTAAGTPSAEPVVPGGVRAGRTRRRRPSRALPRPDVIRHGDRDHPCRRPQDGSADGPPRATPPRASPAPGRTRSGSGHRRPPRRPPHRRRRRGRRRRPRTEGRGPVRR